MTFGGSPFTAVRHRGQQKGSTPTKGTPITIGSSIALIVLGAILTFAVTLEVAGVDINIVGMILMVGGVVGLIFGLTMRQRRITSTVVDRDEPEVY